MLVSYDLPEFDTYLTFRGRFVYRLPYIGNMRPYTFGRMTTFALGTLYGLRIPRSVVKDVAELFNDLVDRDVVQAVGGPAVAVPLATLGVACRTAVTLRVFSEFSLTELNDITKAPRFAPDGELPPCW